MLGVRLQTSLCKYYVVFSWEYVNAVRALKSFFVLFFHLNEIHPRRLVLAGNVTGVDEGRFVEGHCGCVHVHCVLGVTVDFYCRCLLVFFCNNPRLNCSAMEVNFFFFHNDPS